MTLAADHRRASAVLFDPLLAARTALRRLLDPLQRFDLFVHSVFGAELILLAALSFVERSITRDACFGTALVADADVRFCGRLDLLHRLLGSATFLRFGLFRGGFDFALMDLSSSAARRETPPPPGGAVADVLALQLVEE